MPSRKHEVIEHHYDVETGKFSEKNVGTVTNRSKEISRLARERDAGRIATTLSHWMVGSTRVAAQGALELYERQMGDAKEEQS